MISKLFTASRSNIGLTGYFRLFRVGEWTTNAYWAIRTVDEPSYIKELKTTDEELGDRSIDKTIEKFNMETMHELKVTDTLRINGNSIAILLKGIGNIWIKPNYLSLFINMKRGYKLYGSGELNPVYVVRGIDPPYIVGLIMPMRMPEEVKYE